MTENTVQVTIELPISAIVGCAQLFERQGQTLEGVTAEALVQGTVTSMVPWLQKKFKIEPLTEEQAYNYYLRTFAGEQLADDEPEFELIVGKDTFEVARDVDAAVTAKLREKEVAAANRQTEPTEVVDPAKPGKINLLNVNRMEISVLSTIAPKDVIIEKVMKGIGDPIFRAAVEIVYTSLSPELWGTPTAEQAIKDMVARHEE